MTNDHVLLIDTQDRVRTLTLNRPQARNALSSALRTQFFEALRDAESADDVDVVIFTGTDPVFCAGLDLKELGDSTELPDISPKWPEMTKPVIGAINGAAVTGGLELALYCDILIASENARFADTHARVGTAAYLGVVGAPTAEGRRRYGPPDEHDRRLPFGGRRAAGRTGHRGRAARRADTHRTPGGGVDRRQQPEGGPRPAGVVSPHRRAMAPPTAWRSKPSRPSTGCARPVATTSPPTAPPYSSGGGHRSDERGSRALRQRRVAPDDSRRHPAVGVGRNRPR